MLIRSQKIRYLLGGGFNAVFGYGVFVGVYYALMRYGVHYLVIVAISQAIAITCAFFNYRYFVFRSAGNPWWEYCRFVSVYLLAAILNGVVMIALVDWLGLTVLVGQALTVIIVVAVSYFGHRRFTFRQARVFDKAN